MRKYRLCLLVILIAFCIQGCSKQQDVEDHRFVLAMGFERLNEKKVIASTLFLCGFRQSTERFWDQNTIKIGDSFSNVSKRC